MDNTINTKKAKNRTLAIKNEVPATVVNPSTPAIKAKIKKVMVQANMSVSFDFFGYIYRIKHEILLRNHRANSRSSVEKSLGLSRKPIDFSIL